MLLKTVIVMALTFKEAEEKERRVLDRLMEILKPDEYIPSDIGSKCVWDFYFVYQDQMYLGEIKCRNFNSDKYNCIFLEEKKAKNLVYAGYKMGITNAPVYVTHYEDSIIHSLRLTPRILNDYQARYMTVGDIRKRVHLIPIRECKTIEL